MIQVAASYHAILQGYIDCLLETNPRDTLQQWAQKGWAPDQDIDYDEGCLKLIALVILDGIANRAHKILLEMGFPMLIATIGQSYMLPPAPESMLARGLEIIREICGMSGGRASGTLVLGIGNASMELGIEKNRGLHVIVLKQ
jgi:hypothetical protein